MKLRNALTGLVLALSGWFLVSCGSVLAPAVPTPVPTPAPTPGPPVIMAAGDISCDSTTPQLACKSLETSDLILSQIPLRSNVVVLPLGDLQYDIGSMPEFVKNYDRTWGRLNSRSHPAVGNHEYLSPGARGYFEYFQTNNVNVGLRSEGWYTFPVGDWRFFALNSNCEYIGGCDARSPQYRWLETELLLNRSRCTVAYMHYPLYSSGQNADNPQMRPLIQLLYNNGVEIAIAGHDHDFEAFVPMTPQGVPDPARGLRMFVVGTGGRDLTGFARPQGPLTFARSNEHFGALRIEMKENAYDWQFVSISNAVISSGSGNCF